MACGPTWRGNALPKNIWWPSPLMLHQMQSILPARLSLRPIESKPLIVLMETLTLRERGGAHWGPVVSHGQHQDKSPAQPTLRPPSFCIHSSNQHTRHKPGRNETVPVSHISGNLDTAELGGPQRKPHYTGRKTESHRGEEICQAHSEKWNVGQKEDLS